MFIPFLLHCQHDIGPKRRSNEMSHELAERFVGLRRKEHYVVQHKVCRLVLTAPCIEEYKSAVLDKQT